jgi:hypothetical protein
MPHHRHRHPQTGHSYQTSYWWLLLPSQQGQGLREGEGEEQLPLLLLLLEALLLMLMLLAVLQRGGQ